MSCRSETRCDTDPGTQTVWTLALNTQPPERRKLPERLPGGMTPCILSDQWQPGLTPSSSCTGRT
jgi:hypothetical protein